MLRQWRAVSSLILSRCGTIRHASSGKRGGSSARWLQRSKRDPFAVGGQQNSASSFVARSAFKLEQLNDKHRFLSREKIVVDLGASPGGWTQVLAKFGCKHIFALDKLPLHAQVVQQAGARLTVLQGDMLSQEVQERLRSAIVQVSKGEAVQDIVAEENERNQGKVDIIVSDMMANTSGNRIRDNVASLDLLESAFAFAQRMLRRANATVTSSSGRFSSVLILKYFDGPEADAFRRKHLQTSFERVVNEKVAASRSENSEMYFVCFNMKSTTILA